MILIMIPSLVKLSQWIPSESARVKSYFDTAIADNEITILTRYRYSSYAIVCSGVNVAGYTLHIPTRFITAIFYVDLTEISQGCPLDAKHAFSSLYFSVGMTAFLFATCFSSDFALKPEPAPQPPPSPNKSSSMPVSEELLPSPSKSAPVSVPEKFHPTPSTLPPVSTLEEQTITSTADTEASDPSIPPEDNSESPSGPKEKQPPQTLTPMGQKTLKGRLRKHEDLPKEMKYRHIFAKLAQLLQTPTMVGLKNQISQLPASTLQKQCLDLSQMIKTPTNLEITRLQNKDFVKKLRKAKKSAATLPSDHPCVTWIHRLAMERFTKIRLYGYCEQLVIWASEKFEIPLTLENFWKELLKRNKAAGTLTSKEGLNPVGRGRQKLQGHMSIKFDSLSGSNIPRLYGEIVIQNRTITILQHGVPIKHSDAPGIVKQLFGIGQATIPPVTSDYIAFIQAAELEGKNILQLIFENSDKKTGKLGGDESARVQARLALAKYSNFFPIALRWDGAFFFPDGHKLKEIPDPLNHKPPPIRSREIEAFKKKCAEHLLGDIQTTGFLITEGVRKKYASKKELEGAVKGCIDHVQQIYFSENEALENLGDYQAFILLTYVELVYAFCEKLDISILEAFCKDDLDRGGTFKAILNLDYNYRTGHLNPLTLQQLMVNLVAAPLIVKKQAILIKRAICLKYVIDVIRRALNKKARPDAPHAFEGTFSVLTEPCQGIFPTGTTSLSIDEYQEFLETLKKRPIILESTSLVQFQKILEAKSFEQNFEKKLFEVTQSVFENPWLKYHVEQDAPQAQESPKIFASRLKVIDEKGCVITQILTTLTTIDHENPIVTMTAVN